MMEMGEFNSDDCYIYYCGKTPLEEMEQPSQSKELEMQWLGAISKNDRMNLICFQNKPFNITVIQVYAPTTKAEEEVKRFYEDL